jgi:Ca2+-binding EF-hand superfamily protein
MDEGPDGLFRPGGLLARPTRERCERLRPSLEVDFMRRGLWLCGALALGIVGLTPRPGMAQGREGDLPGPIDSIQDLQDTAKMLFKMADTNNDGQISQKEAVDVGNLLVGGFFFRADANGDGVLTPEEARAARETLFQQQPLLRYIVEKSKPTNPPAGIGVANQPAAGAANQPGEVTRAIAANPGQAIGNLLDTNHDHRIEASELRQAVQTGVQTLFTVADANQDGQLSPAELNRAAAEAAQTAVQVAFQTADTDRNGALSMAEFDRALTEPAHAAFRVLDANNDNQLSLDELQRAQQVITNQIQRLRMSQPGNANMRAFQPGAPVGQPTQIAPAPATFPAPATTVRP